MTIVIDDNPHPHARPQGFRIASFYSVTMLSLAFYFCVIFVTWVIIKLFLPKCYLTTLDYIRGRSPGLNKS